MNNKKKLELKKTAIANLTFNDSQMKAAVGAEAFGMTSGDIYCVVVISGDVGYTNCTGDLGKKTK
jgi:hypothetical protein